MAKLYKFGANQLNLTSQEVIPSTGEITNIGKWNNEPPTTQTLPDPAAPALLAFNPQTNNFYWISVDPGDLQTGSHILDFYGFQKFGVETPE